MLVDAINKIKALNNLKAVANSASKSHPLFNSYLQSRIFQAQAEACREQYRKIKNEL
jgi:hypothetical protein